MHPFRGDGKSRNGAEIETNAHLYREPLGGYLRARRNQDPLGQSVRRVVSNLGLNRKNTKNHDPPIPPGSSFH